MKTVFFFLIASSLLLAQNGTVELSWVNAQIAAIKPPRKGINENEISKLKDPFIFLHKEEKKKEEKNSTIIPSSKTSTTNKKTYKRRSYKKRSRFKLSAILNQSALINGKWYKLGEMISGYTLTKVELQKVILKKGRKTLELTTYTKP